MPAATRVAGLVLVACETDHLGLKRSSVRPIQDKQAHTIAYILDGSPASRVAVRDGKLSGAPENAGPALLEDIAE